jgi:hypothetical protein
VHRPPRRADAPRRPPKLVAERLCEPVRLRGFEPERLVAEFGREVAGRAEGDEAAAVEDRDAVAALGLFHQVRRHDDGRAFVAAEAGEGGPELAAGRRVETGGRLVEQEERRTVEQAAREVGAAGETAGERLHAVAVAVAQPEDVEQDVDPFVQCAAAEPDEHAVEAEVLAHRQLGIERGLLENDAEAAADGGGIDRGPVPEHLGRAGGRRHQRRHDPEQRRLAAAVGTEQAEEFAGLHFERESVEGAVVTVRVREVADGESGRRHGGESDYSRK